MADKHTPEDLAGTEQDPSASTQMFRAFVHEGETETARSPKTNGRTLAGIAAAVVLVAILAALFLR